MAESWSKKAKKGESNFFEEGWITFTKVRAYTPTSQDGTPWDSPIVGFWGVPDGDDEEIEAFRLSVGAFEPGDKEGTFVIHESGDTERYPSGGTKYAKLTKSAFDAEVPLEGRDRTVEFGGKQIDLENRDLTIWEGLRVHIEQQERDYSFKDKDTGDLVEGTTSDCIITEFGGVKDLSGMPSGKAEGGSSTEESSGAPADNGTTDDDLESKAAALAKGASGYMDYLETAKGELGIQPTDDLGQKAFYEKSRA